MVSIESRHFGRLEIQEDKILRFPRGLVGFADATTFCLLGLPETEPYQWLQGVTRPDLAFLVLPLQLLDPAYQVALSETERQTLKLEPDDLPLILGIVTVPEDPQDATINKMAPLVLNERQRLGHQVVNEYPGYRTRHLIREAREGEAYASTYPQEKAVLNAR